MAKLAQGVEEDYIGAAQKHALSSSQMYDLFYAAAAFLGVRVGEYTPARLVQAIYLAGYHEGVRDAK